MFLDDPRISNIIFFPRKIPEPKNLPESIQVLKFKVDENIILGGIFFRNDPKLPTILLFHGNGEIALDYQYFAGLFTGCDVNLAVADFRGYGFSSGFPTYSSLFHDAPLVYEQFRDWLQDNGYKNSLFVLGRSLGSTCASEIGAKNPKDLKGVIFESGFADTYRLITGLFGIRGTEITRETLKEWSNDTRITRFKRPTLIIHGTSDWIVPCEQARFIHDALPNEVEKELVLIEGAGHNDIFSHEKEYFSALKKFISKYG
ncbi:MAG: alpha/beta hydrolase [Candidatus Helarchaeales archaeon]